MKLSKEGFYCDTAICDRNINVKYEYLNVIIVYTGLLVIDPSSIYSMYSFILDEADHILIVIQQFLTHGDAKVENLHVIIYTG